MAALVYPCPIVGKHVQAWIADNDDDDDQIFQTVTCSACNRAHLVDTRTGKVLGAAGND